MVYLTLITALSIAGVAAWYSIVGLMAIAAGLDGSCESSVDDVAAFAGDWVGVIVYLMPAQNESRQIVIEMVQRRQRGIKVSAAVVGVAGVTLHHSFELAVGAFLRFNFGTDIRVACQAQFSLDAS